MNIYICDAGEMSVYQETIADWPRYEDERVFNLVVAETRGKAKYLFTQHHDLEFASYPISIRKVMTDIDIQEAFVSGIWGDLFDKIDRDELIAPYEDKCWAVICRKNLMGDNKDYTDCTDPIDCPYMKHCLSEGFITQEKIEGLRS